MTRKRILIVDDEAAIRELLTNMVDGLDFDSQCAETIDEAKTILASGSFDLCLTDMRMPGGSGLLLVEHINLNYPDTPVAVLTAYGDVESAVQSLKAGAFDYVSKPVKVRVLSNLVETATRIVNQAPSNRTILVGNSDAILSLKKQISKLSRTQAPVLVTGSSGTGKELVARMIHENSLRYSGHFVAINCGAIPRDLMESELFGHKRGSFTGAVADKQGLVEVAAGGTLFLDEVTELPIEMQVKLLRVLQERSIRPVGSTEELTTDFRLITATNRNIEASVSKGSFREDLYYRINVVPVRIPSLKHRLEDIPLLIQHIVNSLPIEAGINPTDIEFDQSAMDELLQYDYPGNVRELENIVERSLALRNSNIICAQDLGLDSERNNSISNGVAESPPLENINLEASFHELSDREQRQTIIDTLKNTRYNRTVAATTLGISYRALRYRIKKYGIDT